MYDRELLESIRQHGFFGLSDYDGACPCARLASGGIFIDTHCWRVCGDCEFSGVHVWQVGGNSPLLHEIGYLVLSQAREQWPSTDWEIHWQPPSD